MRAGRQQIGSSLGKMIFHSDDKHRIARKLRGVGKERLNEALAKHGMKGMDADKLAESLSGSKRSTLSSQEMRHVVQALQDVDLAHSSQTAQKMVLTASNQAQDEMKAKVPAGLTPDQIKRKIREMNRERREEANAEEATVAAATTAEEPQGVLDRMRSDVAKANREDREQGTSAAKLGVKAPIGGSAIRDLRDWRQELTLQPKLQIPKQKPPEPPPIAPFQA